MITLAVVSHVHDECKHVLTPVAYLSTQMTVPMGHRYITEICNTYVHIYSHKFWYIRWGCFRNPYEAGNVRDGAGFILKPIYMKAI
jgi:hypothetical protein